MKSILLCFALILLSTVTFASDYHVLAMSDNGRKANVVFHIPVPIETNNAGVSLRTALSQHIGDTSFVSAIPKLSGQALTDLQNGVYFERSETVSFLAADTNLQKQKKIDNRFKALSIRVLKKVRVRLKFWGLSRDVP